MNTALLKKNQKKELYGNEKNIRETRSTYFSTYFVLLKYVRLHYSGSTKIFISGFCTEEQLKIIRKRKKDNGN